MYAKKPDCLGTGRTFLGKHLASSGDPGLEEEMDHFMIEMVDFPPFLASVCLGLFCNGRFILFSCSKINE